MENRLNNFGFDNVPEEPQEPAITVELKKDERLMKITLEMADEDGLFDDELPEDFVGEAFVEHPICVREREFQTFVKVLHYNKLRYRVETLR